MPVPRSDRSSWKLLIGVALALLALWWGPPEARAAEAAPAAHVEAAMPLPATGMY